MTDAMNVYTWVKLRVGGDMAVVATDLASARQLAEEWLRDHYDGTPSLLKFQADMRAIMGEDPSIQAAPCVALVGESSDLRTKRD